MTERRNDLEAPYRGIPLPADWRSVTRVEKGWSRDLKYRVQMNTGPDLLLRLNEHAPPEKRRQEYLFVKNLHARGLPVPRAHAFGRAGAGEATYLLLDWTEGRDLEEALPALDEAARYRLGLEAGRILRAIHQTPLTDDLPAPRAMRERALGKLQRFREAGLQVADSTAVLAFAESRLDWLDSHPPVAQHGDFHPGNLILAPEGHLAVIDFNRFDTGDPVEEFVKLQSFTIEHSLEFALGQLHGYFEGDPDEAFWRSLAVHAAVTALYSIRWAKPFGQREVDGMLARYGRAFRDYRGFTQVVPAWYRPARTMKPKRSQA